MQIETFMEPASDKHTMKRAEYTLKFMASHLRGKAENCLDIGDSNEVGNFITKELELKNYNTTGDLDYNYHPNVDMKYDVVICLEMMEHLMSPKYFLMELKKYLHEDSQIFFSYPSRPKILWTHQHFHEYDKKRFTYLLNQCGYEIIDWQRKYFPQPILSRLRGVRPLLRQFVNFDNLVYGKMKTAV
ncbi:MAG: hypothetical protein KJ799_10470 [Bacteroidetes bacterium]|nr:hypothetical protein [Bacteroidota bacterium]MBU1677527.1 hypothetical protein [Bacteroidota bacterium]MBU2507131.1 hypothetical protein [Bacteroidota bacterium]